MHVAEIELGDAMLLLGSGVIPAYRLGVVMRDALARVVVPADLKLTRRIAHVCAASKDLRCARHVARLVVLLALLEDGEGFGRVRGLAGRGLEGIRKALGHGQLPPLLSLGLISWHSFATLAVDLGEVIGGATVALLRGEPRPANGLHVALGDAGTEQVVRSQPSLGLGVTLLRRQSVPRDGARRVLGYAHASRRHPPEIELSVRVALLGQPLEADLGV